MAHDDPIGRLIGRLNIFNQVKPERIMSKFDTQGMIDAIMHGGGETPPAIVAPAQSPIVGPPPQQQARLEQEAPRSIDLNRDLLARTMWGEARSEGREGMAAVGSVIMNRLKANRWGNSIESVVKAPKQFSAWNEGDPNRSKMESVTAENPSFQEALQIADELLREEIDDPTSGALFYHSASVYPKWARKLKPEVKIGAHTFYKE